MKQKKMNKSKNITKQRSKKRHILLLMTATLAVILVCVGIIGLAYYQKLQIQKRDFKEAESKMEQLRKAFVAELGDPVYQSTKKTCRYVKSGFDVTNGRLGCESRSHLWYVGDNQNIVSSVSKFRKIIDSSPALIFDNPGTPTDEFYTGTNPTYGSVVSTLRNSPEKVSCSVSLSYSLGSEMVYFADQSMAYDKNSNYFLLNLGCSSSPSRPFFPVTEE